MAHRRRERGRKEEEKEPDVKTILDTIEKDISRKPPSKKEIDEYVITALAKKTRDLYEGISRKTYDTAFLSAKDLARLLDKGDPKHLNRWGAKHGSV